MRYVLGFDGGTKTECVLMNETGKSPLKFDES